MNVICGLGNPGAEYDATRHNVGWWLADRLAADWKLGPYRREDAAFMAAGDVGGHSVTLLKPATFMNRSGQAVIELRRTPDFDVSRNLLVIVDDAALDVGRVRFRPHGSSGGHNGLESIEAALAPGTMHGSGSVSAGRRTTSSWPTGFWRRFRRRTSSGSSSSCRGWSMPPGSGWTTVSKRR